MKNTIITILSIVAFVGGFLALFLSGPVEKKTPVTNQAIQQTNIEKNLESKTDEQASVTVIVTPSDIPPQSKEWKFDIVMNTHSVELDQDMIKSAVLIDDQGKEYKPLRWEGSEAGGHHREGILVFSTIQSMSQSVEIKIKDIGGIPERSFKWN